MVLGQSTVSILRHSNLLLYFRNTVYSLWFKCFEIFYMGGFGR